jgi:hypothetical protein
MTTRDGIRVPARAGHEATPPERTTSTTRRRAPQPKATRSGYRPDGARLTRAGFAPAQGGGPRWSSCPPAVLTGTSSSDQRVHGDGA